MGHNKNNSMLFKRSKTSNVKEPKLDILKYKNKQSSTFCDHSHQLFSFGSVTFTIYM